MSFPRYPGGVDGDGFLLAFGIQGNQCIWSGSDDDGLLFFDGLLGGLNTVKG